MKRIVFALFGLAGACATSSHVAPVGPGKVALEGSLGGPLTKLSATVIPAPMIAVKGVYGLEDGLDLHATLHGTPLLFGLLGLELGVKKFFFDGQGFVPLLGVSGGAALVSSLKPGVERTPLFLPLTSGTAAWSLGPGFGYCGADAFFYTRSFASISDAPPFTWAPFVGYRWDWASAWSLALELKRFAANWQTDHVAADLYTFQFHDGLKTHKAQQGALGTTLGLTRRH